MAPQALDIDSMENKIMRETFCASIKALPSVMRIDTDGESVGEGSMMKTVEAGVELEMAWNWNKKLTLGTEEKLISI